VCRTEAVFVLITVFLKGLPELLLCCAALQPVRTFTTPGFSFVHVGNTFESENGTTLDIDLGVFDSATIPNDLKMAALRQGPGEGSDVTGCQYMRLSLPLSEADTDASESSSLPVGFHTKYAAYFACICQVCRQMKCTLGSPFLSCTVSWQHWSPS
jgi:hypothetical protein